MSAATRATSAGQRASIAARLYKTTKPWPVGLGLGRNFDDCFEMGDGDDVKRLLFDKARKDAKLWAAMVAHNAEYMALCPNPNTEAFSRVGSAVQAARAAIQKATGAA